MKGNQSNINNKKSRVLVNMIGIPTLLFIIIAGNDFYEIPLFFLFVFSIMILSKSLKSDVESNKTIKLELLFIFFVYLCEKVLDLFLDFFTLLILT